MQIQTTTHFSHTYSVFNLATSSLYSLKKGIQDSLKSTISTIDHIRKSHIGTYLEKKLWESIKENIFEYKGSTIGIIFANALHTYAPKNFTFSKLLLPMYALTNCAITKAHPKAQSQKTILRVALSSTIIALSILGGPFAFTNCLEQYTSSTSMSNAVYLTCELLGGYMGVHISGSDEHILSIENPLNCYIVKALQAKVATYTLGGHIGNFSQPIQFIVEQLIASIAFNASDICRGAYNFITHHTLDHILPSQIVIEQAFTVDTAVQPEQIKRLNCLVQSTDSLSSIVKPLLIFIQKLCTTIRPSMIVEGINSLIATLIKGITYYFSLLFHNPIIKNSMIGHAQAFDRCFDSKDLLTKKLHEDALSENERTLKILILENLFKEQIKTTNVSITTLSSLTSTIENAFAEEQFREEIHKISHLLCTYIMQTEKSFIGLSLTGEKEEKYCSWFIDFHLPLFLKSLSLSICTGKESQDEIQLTEKDMRLFYTLCIKLAAMNYQFTKARSLSLSAGELLAQHIQNAKLRKYAVAKI